MRVILPLLFLRLSFWPSDMYEPLRVGVVLPFTHHRPWSFKRAPLLVELGSQLRGMLKDSEQDARDLLRSKLLKLPRMVGYLSQHMACRVLHTPWADACVSNVSNQGQLRQPLAQRGGASTQTLGGSGRSTPVHTLPV